MNRALSSVGSEHLVYTQGVRGSNPALPTKYLSESSSVGRASAFQAECRRFEPGLSLTAKRRHAEKRDHSLTAKGRHAEKRDHSLYILAGVAQG